MDAAYGALTLMPSALHLKFTVVKGRPIGGAEMVCGGGAAIRILTSDPVRHLMSPGETEMPAVWGEGMPRREAGAQDALP